LVSLGDFTQRYVWVAIIGLLAILVFMAFRVKGDILWGILVATGAALVLGVTELPDAVTAAPDFGGFFAPFQTPEGTSNIALLQIFTPVLLMAVFAIMLTDFFDTMGTVVAVGEQAGFVDMNGQVPGIRGILTVDSLAASTGGLFGASSITTYIESAAGVAEGGRTGITSIVVAVFFAVGAFLAPIIGMVGGGFSIASAAQYELMTDSGFGVPEGDYFVYPITAGALIVVGFLMMRTISEIPWTNFEEAFPAFLTVIGIPLTYNISYGIGFGFISYTLIKLFHRKARAIHPLMYIVSVAFAVTFIIPYLQSLVD
jgi:AGZA family xanthine/uracil permease-like MFS transporter